MTTCAELIEDCLGLLESWSLDEEQSTTLGGDMTVDDLSFTVTEARGIATGVSPGIIEIGQELLYCDQVSGNEATLVSWGRGYKSTVPAAHAAGSRIVSQPTFPRSKTLRGMNQALSRVFPKLFAVGIYDTTATFPVFTYDLPDTAERVLSVQWQSYDGTQYWRTVNRWRTSPVGPQGVTVDVADSIPPGRPIRFVYAKKPSPLVTESDVFETATGLPASCADLIVLGAAVEMVVSQELSRLQVSSVEQQNRSGLVAPSAALTSSRFLEQRFQARLTEEQESLQQQFPPRVTGVWL